MFMLHLTIPRGQWYVKEQVCAGRTWSPTHGTIFLAWLKAVTHHDLITYTIGQMSQGTCTVFSPVSERPSAHMIGCLGHGMDTSKRPKQDKWQIGILCHIS